MRTDFTLPQSLYILMRIRFALAYLRICLVRRSGYYAHVLNPHHPLLSSLTGTAVSKQSLNHVNASVKLIQQTAANATPFDASSATHRSEFFMITRQLRDVTRLALLNWRGARIIKTNAKRARASFLATAR